MDMEWNDPSFICSHCYLVTLHKSISSECGQRKNCLSTICQLEHLMNDQWTTTQKHCISICRQLTGSGQFEIRHAQWQPCAYFFYRLTLGAPFGRRVAQKLPTQASRHHFPPSGSKKRAGDELSRHHVFRMKLMNLLLKICAVHHRPERRMCTTNFKNFFFYLSLLRADNDEWAMDKQTWKCHHVGLSEKERQRGQVTWINTSPDWEVNNTTERKQSIVKSVKQLNWWDIQYRLDQPRPVWHLETRLHF